MTVVLISDGIDQQFARHQLAKQLRDWAPLPDGR